MDTHKNLKTSTLKTQTMKKFLLLSCAIVVASAATAQTIRIADNNATRPTGPNIYPTLQAAINAAVPGDLI